MMLSTRWDVCHDFTKRKVRRWTDAGQKMNGFGSSETRTGLVAEVVQCVMYLRSDQRCLPQHREEATGKRHSCVIVFIIGNDWKGMDVVSFDEWKIVQDLSKGVHLLDCFYRVPLGIASWRCESNILAWRNQRTNVSPMGASCSLFLPKRSGRWAVKLELREPCFAFVVDVLGCAAPLNNLTHAGAF